jgi:pyrimidine deaminase RibD-like protein
MRMALAEGLLALPACLPNPPVGCVLVRNGEVIARGHTQRPGENHAEAAALRRVKGALPDVTAYVTLEPCSFHGRTPSCALSLIERQIGRVVVALVDPDKRNNGAGIQLLRDAGVAVIVGVLEDEARANLSPFLALPANFGLERSRRA